MASQLFKQAFCLGIFAVGFNSFAQGLFNVTAEDLLLLRSDRCSSIDLSETVTLEAGSISVTRNYTLDLPKLRTNSQTLEQKFENKGLKIPRRDLFLNERTGELTIRATRKEFPLIEEVVAPFVQVKAGPGGFFAFNPAELLSAPQILIESCYVEYSGGLPFALDSKQDTVASNVFKGILTAPQFEKAIRAIENTQGVDILTAPSVRTISGRQTRTQVETEKTIMFQTPPRQPRRVTPDSDPTPIEITKPGT